MIFMRNNIKSMVDKNIDINVDILCIGDVEGERKYMEQLRDSYVRTICDIHKLLNNKKKPKILEIGSYLGVVSITLKQLGYDVISTEIPEYCNSESLKGLYDKNHVSLFPLDLSSNKLPFDSCEFDVIIICEVLEHLNFNPLPVIGEFKRVLKKSGYLYVGMPNSVHILNRVKMLFGKSISNSIADFFDQLDKNKNMIVGIHWREYTMAEVHDVLLRMGFKIEYKYYFSNINKPVSLYLLMMFVIKKVLYIIPSFRQSVVIVGMKK